MFVSLVNAFTNYRDVKGSKPKKSKSVSKLTYFLSDFNAVGDPESQQSVTNVVRLGQRPEGFRGCGRGVSVATLCNFLPLRWSIAGGDSTHYA